MRINWRFWRSRLMPELRDPQEQPESSVEKRVHFRVLVVFVFLLFLWFSLIESVRRLQIKRMTDDPMFVNHQQISSQYFRPLFTPDQQLVVVADTRSSGSLSGTPQRSRSKWSRRSRLCCIKSLNTRRSSRSLLKSPGMWCVHGVSFRSTTRCTSSSTSSHTNMKQRP